MEAKHLLMRDHRARYTSNDPKAKLASLRGPGYQFLAFDFTGIKSRSCYTLKEAVHAVETSIGLGCQIGDMIRMGFVLRGC